MAKNRSPACVIALAVIFAVPAFAQNYPSKGVRLIVPFSAGGGSDVIGRILTKKLTERTGQSFVVDNRAGAGGSIGTELAVRSAPDGYTMVLAGTSEIAINPSFYSKLNYDTLKDLIPVVLVASTPMVLVVHPSLPVKSVKDVIALARAKPRELNVASSGTGTITHLSGELFREMAKVTWTHVPYKGSGPALTDLAAGQVQMAFSTLPAAIALIQSKRIKPIATSMKTRAASLPDVPTVSEGGLPGYVTQFWAGIFVPTGTPNELVAWFWNEVTQLLKQQDIITSLASQGATPGALTQPQFVDYVKTEVDTWSKVVKASGAKAE